MLTELRCKSFKGLFDHHFELRPLTILAGSNGSGKSSIVQSLLLAKMTTDLQSGSARVPLNGKFGLLLGEALDVFYHGMGFETNPVIEIEVKDETKPYKWSFMAEDEHVRSLTLVDRPSEPPIQLKGDNIGDFTYLGAARALPSEHQALQSAPTKHISLGSQGEHSAEVLVKREYEPIGASMRHIDAGELPFGKQVEAWLKMFVGDVLVKGSLSSEYGVASIKFRSNNLESEWVRPGNMGFGVTYCLPIILAALSANRDSILLIDTPEAHLHPAAQSKMGQFLGRLIANNVQVILETHSDHIINGVRLATVLADHPLKYEDVIFHNLRSDGKRLVSDKIEINENGNLSSRPIGFLDQTEMDIHNIVLAKRKAN